MYALKFRDVLYELKESSIHDIIQFGFYYFHLRPVLGHDNTILNTPRTRLKQCKTHQLLSPHMQKFCMIVCAQFPTN